MEISAEVIYKSYDNCDKKNYWIGTPYETYSVLGAKSKGVVGEEIVKTLLASYDFDIKKRTNPGHDAIVFDIKTEIKFSLASKRNMNYEFTFNHIGINKDWERIIFCGVNGDLNCEIKWFTNEEIKEITHDKTYFAKQEGPDDFFSMGKHSTLLLQHPYAKNMEDW